MLVLVPKTSGFCPGVKRAEDGVFKLREESDKVNIYGALIHNQDYTRMLQTHNINSVFVDQLSKGDTLVIRTHGIPKDEESRLKKEFILKDMTCPIVKRVQKQIEKESLQNAYVIISGKKDHAEVLGLVSYAKNYLVIENQKDLDNFLKNISIPKDCKKIFVLSQTTHSREFFEILCRQIQSTIKDIPITIKDTICPITENKEQESLLLQKEVDFTVVIGDLNSSNSKKLYTVLKNDMTIFTQNLSHLQSLELDWEGVQTVLVVSSTSTPLFIEKEIVEYLESI